MENRKKELKDVIVFIMDYLNEVVGMQINGEWVFNFQLQQLLILFLMNNTAIILSHFTVNINLIKFNSSNGF